MNNVWVGTDWHLWSVNSVTDKRHQFRSISNLGRLSDAYAEDIQSDDIFIYLGDLCDPGVTDIKKLKAIVSSIPGYKVLCKGNHDTQDDTFYKEIGFDVVCEICVIHNLVFSHKPVRVPMGYLNIHGHLHTEKMSTLGYQHINAYDSNFFERPMLVDDLIDSAAFQSPEEYAGTDLKHVEEKFEKYTSVENDTYTQIVDLTDMVGLYPVDEAVELPTFKTPEDLSKWMKSNVHYANFTKLKSSDGVAESKSGSCHDQVVFEYNALKNMGKKPKILFFIAYKEGSNQGGMTHSLVYYNEGSKVKWFENSWSGMEGIHTYDSLSDLKADIKRIYSNMPDAKNFPELEFKSASISDFDTGMNLGEFVSGIMDEAANDPLDEVLFSDITDVQYWENDDDAPKKKKVKQSPLDTDDLGVVAESANSQLLKLFFISSEGNLHETEMTPRIPENYMTENGYEDNKTPRISFSTSIDGCLMALGKNVSNQVFYVYQPVGKYKVITPTIDQVPDVKITKERWICEPVNLVRVGKIRAIDENGPHDDGIPYTYGKNGEHEARLYHWGWKWIKQFKYDLNESATMNTFPFIFLSQENMNDELYPEGKMLLRNMDDAVQELYLYQRPTGEYYVHNTEPGYYRLIMSPEFSAGYFSMDTINLTAVGKIKVNPDYSWEWIEKYDSDMNEAKGLGSRVYQLVNLDKTMTESSSYVSKSKFNGYTETIYHLDEFRKAYQRSGKTSSGIPDDIDTVSTFFEDILDNYNQIAPETLDRDKIAACKSADDLIELFYARANTFGNDLADEYTSSIEMLHHLINLKTNPANKARFDEIVPMNLSKDEFVAFINKRIDEMDNIEAFVVAALKSNLQMYGIIRREIQYLEESSTNKEHVKALKEYMNKHEDEFIHIRTKNGVCTYEYDFSAFGRGKVYVDNHIYEQSHDLVKPSRLLIRATLYDYIVYSHGIDSTGQYVINDIIIDNRVFRNVADIVTYLQKGTPKRILIMACNNNQVVYDSNDLRFANVKYPSREMIMEAAVTDTASDSTKLLKVWKSQIDSQLRNVNRVHKRVVKLISDDDFVLYPKECSLIFAKTSSKSGKLVYQEKFKIEDQNTFINTMLASIDSLIKLYERTCFVCKMMINIINDAYKGILTEAGYGWEIKPVTGLSWAPYDYRFGYQYHTQQECFNDLALCHELFYESSCDHYQGRVFSVDNPNYWRFTEKNLKPAIMDRYNKSQLNEMYLNSLSAAVEDTTELHEMSPKDKQAIANKYGLRTPGEYQQDDQDKTQERVNQRREKQLKDLKKARKIKKRKAFVRKVKSHLPGAQNESAMGILSMPKVVSSPPFDVDDKVDLYVGLANKKINEYGKTAKNIPVPKRKFKKNSNKNRVVPDYYLKLWFNPDRATNLLINDAAPNQHTIWLYPDEYCTLMFVCADGVCRVYMLDSYIAGDYRQFLGTFQVDMGIGARLKAALKEDSSGVDDSESNHYEADATDRDPLWGDRNHFFKHPNAAEEDYDKSIQENYKFELVDKNLRFIDRLDEATTKSQKLYPVYVVLVHSGTGVSKAIKAISHSEYSHASICFDSSLDKMYSFARKDPRNPFIGGFRYESIGKGFYEQKEIPYAVYVVPCTENQIKKMKKRLNYFIQNQEKFTFDFTGLVTNYLGIVNNPAHRWFCSRFVADVLNAGAPKNNPYVAEPSLQDPDDFKDTDWAIYVDSGENLMKYDRKKVDRKTNQIIRKEMLRRMTVNESAIFDLDAFNPFIESTLNYQFAMMDEAAVDDFVRYLKSFKVKFDKEGNVIISRREVDQLDKHFRQSLRMIKAYENAGDLDSVKLELCKINYMIELINEYYLSPKAMKSKRVKADLRKEMLDLRSVMLNAFSQHLKYVKTIDPAFNFKSYYDTSIYGKNIEIPKPVLTAIGKAIVTQL